MVLWGTGSGYHRFRKLFPRCQVDFLLDGDESLGGTKKPYDPRIHFVLIREAYLDANPGNQEVADILTSALDTFDEIYGGERPGFLEGYKALKEKVKPWGA